MAKRCLAAWTILAHFLPAYLCQASRNDFGGITSNVPRATRSLGLGERDVLSSTNVTKVDNVSIKHNTQIFGARCYKLYAAICFGQIIS